MDRQEADLLLAHRRAKAECARHHERIRSLLEQLQGFADVRPQALAIGDGKLWNALLNVPLSIPDEARVMQAVTERASALAAERGIRERLDPITG